MIEYPIIEETFDNKTILKIVDEYGLTLPKYLIGDIVSLKLNSKEISINIDNLYWDNDNEQFFDLYKTNLKIIRIFRYSEAVNSPYWYLLQCNNEESYFVEDCLLPYKIVYKPRKMIIENKINEGIYLKTNIEIDNLGSKLKPKFKIGDLVSLKPVDECINIYNKIDDNLLSFNEIDFIEKNQNNIFKITYKYYIENYNNKELWLSSFGFNKMFIDDILIPSVSYKPKRMIIE